MQIYFQFSINDFSMQFFHIFFALLINNLIIIILFFFEWSTLRLSTFDFKQKQKLILYWIHHSFLEKAHDGEEYLPWSVTTDYLDVWAVFRYSLFVVIRLIMSSCVILLYFFLIFIRIAYENNFENEISSKIVPNNL